MAGRTEVEVFEDPQDNLQLDESTLDPSLHYRFCNELLVTKRRAQGYELVLRSESGVKLENEELRTKTADDLIKVGDLVLMACRLEVFERRRKQKEGLTSARLSSSETRFVERARSRGVRTLMGGEKE